MEFLQGQPCDSFTYEQLLAREVVYRHDGSETSEDSLEFQLDIHSKSVPLPGLDSASFSLSVIVHPVNDAPQLSAGSTGRVLTLSAKGQRVLDDSTLLVWDPDDGPDSVKIQAGEARGGRAQVIEASGAHVDVDGREAREFSQRQLLSGEVSVVAESEGFVRLVARDTSSRSEVLELKIVAVAVEVRLERNTGIRLLHHSAATIHAQCVFSASSKSRNLSFAANVAQLEVWYRVVDLPERGLLECSQPEGHFRVCARFSQTQINKDLVRYRHSSGGHVPLDSFSFQVSPLLPFIPFRWRAATLCPWCTPSVSPSRR